jgi:hypothetical protein
MVWLGGFFFFFFFFYVKMQIHSRLENKPRYAMK